MSLTLPQARKTDPETSKEAARKAPRYERAVFIIRAVFARSGKPMTDSEIYHHWWVGSYYFGSPQNLRGARNWMVQTGELVKVDELGKSEYGRKASRWYFT